MNHLLKENISFLAHIFSTSRENYFKTKCCCFLPFLLIILSILEGKYQYLQIVECMFNFLQQISNLFILRTQISQYSKSHWNQQNSLKNHFLFCLLFNDMQLLIKLIRQHIYFYKHKILKYRISEIIILSHS
jgi:hypothetical protein